MKNLFRGICLGLLVGVLVGWRLAEDKQRRDEAAAQEAYLNDPEVAAIRKERALEQKIEAAISDLEDNDAS